MSQPLFAVDDLNGVLRAFNRLGKEANKQLRAAVQKMASGHAAAISSAMAGSGDRRLRELASHVRAGKDRVPKVDIGYARRLPISGNPRGLDVLYGAEFGANQQGPNGWRFPPRTAPMPSGRGNLGYTIYPTLRGRQATILREWESTVDNVVKEWGRR